MKKNIFGLLVALIAMVIMATSALGAIVVVEPNVTIIDIPQINVSNANFTVQSIGDIALANESGGAIDSIAECNVTLTNSITDNSTTVITIPSSAATFANLSGLASGVTWSALVDAPNYTLVSIYCINTSGDTTDNLTSGVEIFSNLTLDFSVPTAPTYTTDNDKTFDSKDAINITATISRDNTIDCLIVFEQGAFPNNQKYYSYPDSSGTCSFDVSMFDQYDFADGIYRYIIAASDTTNFTNASTFREFRVEEGKAGMSNLAKAQQLAAAGYSSVETQGGTWDLSSFSLTAENLTKKENLVPLLIIGGIVYYMFFYKKKKR